ncbi:S41 family peptidase [Lacinutrix iliipiscaria]|uniref:S41 family peptidase n=1 Tax=Lacinutrix iliipiscaria TaxID=1230532 RepID=A0ABW5WRJ4_9FLAO
MMKIKKIALLILVATVFTGCFEDLDDNPISSKDVKDFVWKGMNSYYLYKENIPNLANDRFTNDSEYSEYLNGFSTPEELFESLIHDREHVDRFSWITSDYIALEQFLSGNSQSTGAEFDFYFEPGSTTQLFGVIRLVLNNSPAENQGLQRGQIFNAINGTSLTESNYSALLNQSSYTLNLANYNNNGTPSITDDSIDSTSESVTLSRINYSENPIHKTEIIEVNGENVGYLMYNGFTSSYNNQLNFAFDDFQANNVQHLILDLRYNPGGSILSATLLGSMITGQFNGEVFSKLEYNSDLQSNNTIYNFTDSFSGNSINSLNLNKVYILTTDSSASASEMIINSLSPYIDVIQIGQVTTGKSQASITIYDSPDYGRSGANPNHNYALQPLVAKTVNSLDQSVPSSGITPTITINENPMNYGALGHEDEPLLATAIQHIIDNGRVSAPEQYDFKRIKSTVDDHPLQNDMYID